MSEDVCREFSHSLIDLFTTRRNRSPSFMCRLFHIPWGERERDREREREKKKIQHQWDDLSIYAFPPFALLRQVLPRVMLSPNDGSTIVTKEVVPRPSGFYDGGTSRTPHAEEPAGTASCEKISQGSVVAVPTIHAYKLSRDSSTRPDFVRRLWKSPKQTSGSTQHVFIRKSGLDFLLTSKYCSTKGHCTANS